MLSLGYSNLNLEGDCCHLDGASLRNPTELVRDHLFQRAGTTVSPHRCLQPFSHRRRPSPSQVACFIVMCTCANLQHAACCTALHCTAAWEAQQDSTTTIPPDWILQSYPDSLAFLHTESRDCSSASLGSAS